MALRGHDEVVRQAVAAHDGHVFSTGGDGFAVAFPTVADAVRAAVAVQQGLQGTVGDEGTALAVRMGLHAGAADERDGDYFGPVVNRAARIMAAAHGGQILISGVAARLLGTEMAGLELRELGTHRLRDLVTPERSCRSARPSCARSSHPCARAGPATSGPRPALVGPRPRARRGHRRPGRRPAGHRRERRRPLGAGHQPGRGPIGR